MACLTIILNCAARIITNTKQYDHITRALRKLHWLPVRYGIQYKTLFITYKAITGMEPDYLCRLISIQASARSLRSSKEIVLHVPVWTPVWNWWRLLEKQHNQSQIWPYSSRSRHIDNVMKMALQRSIDGWRHCGKQATISLNLRRGYTMTEIQLHLKNWNTFELTDFQSSSFLLLEKAKSYLGHVVSQDLDV